jgi:hypothetical protein
MPKVVSRSAVSSSSDGPLPIGNYNIRLTYPVSPFFHSTANCIFRCSPACLLCVHITIIYSLEYTDPHQTVFVASSSYVHLSFFFDLTCRHVLQLVIDKNLATLPRRKTDNAIIIRSQDSDVAKARVFKLNAGSGEPILLERYEHVAFFVHATNLKCPCRQGGHERQYRFHCPRCSLVIGYQSSPPPAKSAPFLYIVPGALTQMQGQLPPDAFQGEVEGE